MFVKDVNTNKKVQDAEGNMSKININDNNAAENQSQKTLYFQSPGYH